MSHALARSANAFAAARAMLGLGESANFPGAVKTVALWFPKRERALAVGVFNAGSNVGAVIAVAIVSLAAAAHQWWSANLFTSVGDMFPSAAVASVVGMGGFVGAMAAMLFQRYTGALLDATNGNYVLVFRFCGSAYLVALALFHLLAPRLQPVTTAVEERAKAARSA